MAPRRFPPSWKDVEMSGGYIVEDASGQRLTWFYGRADANIAHQASRDHSSGRASSGTMMGMPSRIG
jgi:hypothetical protein